MNLSTKSALDVKNELLELAASNKPGPMDFSTKKVVSGSRKRAPKKVSRYDAIPDNPPTEILRDAGGGNAETGEPGIGHEKLKVDELAAEQLAMFKRSNLTTTILDEDNREQEVRQTKLVVEYHEICVNMRREDFPSITADVPVRFTDEALQAAWGTFLFDVRKALNVEFIDSILDRRDMAPVNRILELRDGGQYFVRQREESAILEVIQSGKIPEQTSWVITEGISKAKLDIRESAVVQKRIDVKVDEILSRPTLREHQREATFRILEAQEVEEITEAMWEIMNAEDLPPEEFAAAMTKKMNMEAEAKKKEDERQARLAHLVATGGDPKEILELSQKGNMQAALGQGFGTISTKTYDKEVDIIGLYRLSFETIQRLLLNAEGDADKKLGIARASFAFVKDTMEKFKEEVDICVLGAKVLSDLSDSLIEYRVDFYNIIMDAIQLYAPENESFRPPRVIRRKMTDQEKQIAEEEWKDQLEADKSGKGKDTDAKQTKIDFEIDVKGGGELVFNLEEYLAEQEEIKRREAEAAAAEAAEKERLRLEALAALEVVEEKPKGPFKKVKKPWRGSKGYVGKPIPEEEEHQSEFDGYDDESKKKKRTLKGFKSFKGSRELPVVPGIKFRGLVGPYKNDMAMLQCFATLYKFVCASYGNREKAFSVDMPEEVASIGLVCLGNTRVMEYTMWIIDTIYMDGFMVEPDELESVNPSMAISADAPASTMNDQNAADENDAMSTLEPPSHVDGSASIVDEQTVGGDMSKIELDEGFVKNVSFSEDKRSSNNDKDPAESDHHQKGEIDKHQNIHDPLIGTDIELASNVSMPTIDLDGHNVRLREDLDVNMGDPNIKYDDAFTFKPDLDDNNSEDLTANLALDPEDKERANRYKDKGIRESTGMIDDLGEDLYEVRYTRRPRDPVVLFCAMASCHGDLQDREREMGKKWIGIWDDASDRYKRLIVVGSGLSGLN